MSSQKTSSPKNTAISWLLSVTVSVATATTVLLWLSYQYQFHSSSHGFIGNKCKKGKSTPKEDSSSSDGGARRSTQAQDLLPQPQGHEDAVSEDEDDDEDNQDNNLNLPQHLEREFYKDKRRRQMIPFLAMKKTMYDNIGMFDPDGHHLCNISMKKANWYINKNLATWTNNESSTDVSSIQLSFHPKIAARSSKQDATTGLVTYNRGKKMNQCVVCGAQRDYMRHYIVPYCYRSLFPVRFKTHMTHDVVLLCAETCHARADCRSQQRMMRLEKKLRMHLDPETEPPQIMDRQLHQVQSAAQALLKWKDRIPANRILEYQELLVDWWQLDSIDALTNHHLMQASQVEARRPNPKHIPGPKLVMNHVLLKSSGAPSNGGSTSVDMPIAQFVRDWRLHFLQTMQPKFLPIGWSVDSPVQCDDDRGSSSTD
jgi:hypothetical protein